MITSNNLTRTLTVALLCCGVVGCGGPKTHPVGGRVVYGQEEAPAGDLVGYGVTAVGADPPITAVGVIEDDGSFVLSTFGDEDGAVAGRYRVALTPPLPYGDEPPSPVLIDAKYLDPDTSGLEINIPGDEQVVLTVQRPAAPE